MPAYVATANPPQARKAGLPNTTRRLPTTLVPGGAGTRVSAKRPAAQREQARCIPTHQHEHPAPAHVFDQQRTDHRRDQRDCAQPGHAARQRVRAVHHTVGVAHGGARADQDRAHRQALAGARGDQPSHVGADRRGERGQCIQANAGQQHRPAADAVRQRATRQLAEAHRQHEHRQAGRRIAQINADRGQRGQIAVGGDRLRSQQQRQQPTE